MATVLIIALILAVLVGSVVVSSLSHKREQEAAERRQKAAEYRARIQETQELLEGLQNAGLDASVRAVLMVRIAENLIGLKQCEPNTPNIDSSLTFAREQAISLKAQAGTCSPLVLPDNEQALFATLKHMRRLLQVFSNLNQFGKVDPSEYAVQFPRLQKLLLRFEVEGYMKLGMQALNLHQQGSARTYFEFTYNRLISSAVTDDYTQQQLAVLQDLMDHLDRPNEATEAAPAHDELVKDDTTDLFQPKKKW